MEVNVNMEQENVFKKVKVSEVRPNSILARDVVTKTGVVILAKNTMLNSVNFTKIEQNDVNYVYVWEDSIDDTLSAFNQKEVYTVEEQSKAVVDKPEFKEFQSTYTENIQETKSVLQNIGNGKSIAKAELFEITKGVMEKVNCKSDIFTYLRLD